MGYKYEVLYWTKTPRGTYEYDWRTVYTGQSLLKAIYIGWKMKRKKTKAIKIIWR